MYSRRSGLILGFHGCDLSIAEKVIHNGKGLKISENSYDWLGNGLYFWENSPARALEYATYLKNNPRKGKRIIKTPAVIGAVIDLGNCLDLLDYGSSELLKESYEILKASLELNKLPKNKLAGSSGELLLRELDCAVIETLHGIKDKQGSAFHTVKGAFFEGGEIYPNSGFREKDHIQICVRNPSNIKGYFKPRNTVA